MCPLTRSVRVEDAGLVGERKGIGDRVCLRAYMSMLQLMGQDQGWRFD